MFDRLRELFIEQPGREYERLKWLVGLGLVFIFGSVYVGCNRWLLGNVGWLYGFFFSFSMLAAVVILHYSGHRNKKLGAKLARWELVIGCALIVSCVAMLMVIRHYVAMVNAEIEYTVKRDKYETKKTNLRLALKREETEQGRIALERDRIGLDRTKEARRMADADKETSRNIRRAAESGTLKDARFRSAGDILPASTPQTGPSPAPVAVDVDEDLEKPQKPPSSQGFLERAEWIIGTISGLETLLAWIAIGTTLRQGTIRANEEHERQVDALRKTPALTSRSLVDRVNAVAQDVTSEANVDLEEGANERSSLLPFPSGESVSRDFSTERSIGKDPERSGKIGNDPAEVDRVAVAAQTPTSRQEIPAPEIGPGFFLVKDRRRSDPLFNLSRRTPTFRKGLLICQLTPVDLAEMSGATEDAWRAFLIRRIEQGNPRNRELIIRTVRTQQVA